MSNTPETIYLIQGEYDGERGLVWCDDPAPDEHCDPAEAVKYVRADVHQAIIDRQGKAAIAGMDAAKKHAFHAEKNAKRLHAESSPRALESERAMNEALTEENEQLRARVAELEECIDDGSDAWLLRKQAEAVEQMGSDIGEMVFSPKKWTPAGALNMAADACEQYAHRLRHEAEKAGGES